MNTLDINTIENYDLIQLNNYLGLNKKDFKLLLEAYRRKNIASQSKAYTIDLGIGLKKEYKSKFFTCSEETEQPNKVNRYKLTSAGIATLKIIENYLPIPYKITNVSKVNNVLYRYN